MIDLHMHTARCGHATGTIREYVEAGRAAGLEVMCFTDHLPMPEPCPQHYTMRADELDAYLADVRAVAADAARSGGPEVLAGVEADWLPGHMDEVAAVIGARQLDLVLGSVHFIEDWAFDDPDLVERYGRWEIDALWARYFAEFDTAARSGIFDVMAHPDLVKKFGFRAERDPGAWYRDAALAMADGGIAVEVNTAGLRKPVGEIYPSLAFLRVCREAGVPATTGSDAHAPAEVAAGIPQARDLLRAAGYTSLVVFRGRQAEEVAL